MSDAKVDKVLEAAKKIHSVDFATGKIVQSDSCNTVLSSRTSHSLTYDAHL